MAKKKSRKPRSGILVDKKAAAQLLDEVYGEIEARFQHDGEKLPAETENLNQALDALFSSETQAFREALVGCCVAHILHPEINIKLPYAKQAPNAFSGRTLDQAVINPFFKRARIPSSTGPYLSTIRRNARFNPEQETHGIRDVTAFRGLLTCLDYVEELSPEFAKSFLGAVLNRFLILRETSKVALVRIERFSVVQFGALINAILDSASGGRWPVILATAMLRAISTQWGMNWTVDSQGINVADAPSGAAGDITVRAGDHVLLAAEVTERIVDRTRVMTVFNAKIADAQIRDYIFFAEPDSESRPEELAQQYFAQGYEINFVDLSAWLHHMLVTIGVQGRDTFVSEVLAILEEESTPGSVKVTWNSVVTKVAAGGE